MIAFLEGTLLLRDDPYIIVNVSGVGYRVVASQAVLSKLGNVGEKITMYIHTHVREDALDLYGFSEQADLKLFEQLIGVSGVGPKTALGIFSVGTRAEIVQAVITGNVLFFTGVPRLGKKNAQKIIIELKGKFGSIQDLDLSESDLVSHNEVVDALLTFGFSKAEIQKALQGLQLDGLSLSEKVKQALKALGRKA
ncbi:MAG: Holliday junction branch migration protein RuvA [Patescibacteria group bacterium]